MKIAIIIERADINLGGAERSVFELEMALSALGHQVTILAAKGTTEAKNIRILCGKMSGKRTSLKVFGKAIKKHLVENKYDIVHSVLPFDFADVYQPRGGSYAETIARNAASYQNKIIEIYKKITAYTNIRRLKLLHVEKRLCKNPNGPTVAALSRYVADQFRKHYNLDEDRLAIISNGVKINDRIDKYATEALRTAVLRQLGLKEADDPLFLLFAATNFRLKGLSCLIKALSVAVTIPAEKPCFLIVVGNDSSLGYRLLAKNCGVADRIVFLGKLHHIQDVLAVSDVAVLPTYYDPASRFILEALAAGKPVITTKFNGATDLFLDNRQGKIIDKPENIPALAEAITYFADTANIIKAQRFITEDNLKDTISIMRAASEIEKLYLKILDRKKIQK